MNEIDDASLIVQCQNIRIATPGSIQPHGAILAVNKITDEIDYVSANLSTFLPSASDAWLKQSATIAGVHDLHQNDQQRHALMTNHQLHISCLESPYHYLYEFERTASEDSNIMTTLGESLQALLSANDGLALHKIAMKHLQHITGFGHMMVYRFDADWHGVVIHELIDPENIERYGSYLNLHFPESDIPSQARELYQKQWLRMIADVLAEPSSVLSHLEMPLDLSHSGLRSVAPSHVQYLKNMGVAASLSVSIIVNGQLWGLLAAHHAQAKPLSRAKRKAAEEFAKLYSALLELNIKKEQQAWIDSNNKILSWPMESAKNGHSPFVNIEQHLSTLVSVFDCVGAIAWEQGIVAKQGLIPALSVIEPIVTQLLETDFEHHYFATTQLGQWFAPIPQSDFAGLLALSAPKEDGRLIIFFRKEQPQEIVWGGDPRVNAMTQVNHILTPRNSFDAWRQTLTGQSRQWTVNDTLLASSLARHLILAQATLNTLQNAQKNAKLNMVNLLLHDLGNAVSGISGVATQLRHIHTDMQGQQNIKRIVQLIAAKTAQFDAALGEGKGIALKNLLDEVANQMLSTHNQAHELTLAVEAGVIHARELLDLQKMYAQSDGLYSRECHLAELLSDATHLLSSMIGSRGELSLKLSSHLPAMNVDRSKMMQIIINVLKNSCEAWDALQVIEPRMTIQLITECTDHVVKLLIIDNGIGFDADIAASLWSLNFSTKERSSGLGLASCKKLAESCRVKLDLHSVGLHNGATATLIFPKEIWA